MAAAPAAKPGEREREREPTRNALLRLLPRAWPHQASAGLRMSESSHQYISQLTGLSGAAHEQQLSSRCCPHVAPSTEYQNENATKRSALLLHHATFLLRPTLAVEPSSRAHQVSQMRASS
jgi:hypothetical protein